MSTPKKPPETPKLYIEAKIGSRWIREIQSGDRTYFFSPFVTGRTAERVLLANGHGHVELYTVFKAENFAAGASSLHCLQRLVKGGIKVYHVPHLHAKMLLIPGRAVTIGSQNLTSGGTKNREASVFLTHPKSVSKAETEAMRWLEDRLLITAEMIDQLMAELLKLKKLFKKAKAAAEELDKEVDLKRREREEEVRKSQEEEAKRRRRLVNLRESVSRLRVAAEEVNARVRAVTGWSRSEHHINRYSSLIADTKHTLIKWKFGSKETRLEDCNRYPCMIEETGKLGWARVVTGRITFVAKGIIHGRVIVFSGTNWKVSTTAVWETLWETPSDTGANVVFTLETLNKSTQVELHCWFSVDGLELESVQWKKGSFLTNPIDFESAFVANINRLRDNLMEYVLRTFTFTDGQKLNGPKAPDFFGEVGQRYVLRLASIGEHKLLIARHA